MKKLLPIFLILLCATAEAKINETTWTPDTCNNCSYTYEWDDSVPADQRVHTFKRIDKSSPDHQGLSGAAQYARVLEENQRKNKVDGQLRTISNMVTTDENGSVIYKPGVGFNFAWSGQDDSRVLTITVYGYTLTNQQKNAVKNWADQNIGVNKVVIQ